MINATVGKTFQKENIETPGCQFCPFGAKIDNKIIKFKIFDMSGKEMYKTLVQSYLKNSSLIILVCDITNRKSFENIDTWINDIKSVTEKGKIILIGNKSDLEEERVITEKEAMEKCELNELTEYMECSCKNGINVEEIFIKVAKILYDPNTMNLENVLKKSIKTKKRSCPCFPFSCCWICFENIKNLIIKNLINLWLIYIFKIKKLING